MGVIKYLVGDATAPQSKNGQGIIAHVCNDVGGWGSGFVMAISKKWKQPEEEYRRISPKKRKVGYVQMVVVGDNLLVANMIGQNGLRYNEYGVPAVNYAAIEVALNKVAAMACSMNVDIHMPRIGCGLAGGSWEVMELIILRVLRNHKCDVYVYDFPDKDDNITAKLK
jgi:O-acetyl-ADP-ribose deacetylase (regulator of RNase III)